MAQINANITPPIGNAAQPEAQQDGLIEQPRRALAQGIDRPRIGHQDRPLTFQGLFSDPTRDPCQGDYGRIMRRFGAEGANIIDGMALFRQAALNPRPVLQAYLACVATVRGPRIYCLHSPATFTAALDGMATIVQFPETCFSIVNGWAKTSDHIMAHLDDFNEFGSLDPVVEHDDTVSHAFARLLIYLPLRYAAHLLDARGYTPRQVWDTLYPKLVADNVKEVCQPLIDWLRLASTATAVVDEQGQDRMGPAANYIRLITPMADRDLLTHAAERLHQYLPSQRQEPPHPPPAQVRVQAQQLQPPVGAGVENALTQVAQALVLQVNAAQAAQEAKLIAEATPKLPSQSEKFKHTLHILLALLKINEERTLPGLWQQWANCPKKQEFVILRDLLDNYARGPSRFSHFSPVVTIKLVQDLSTFDFVGISEDDYDTGLSPFAVADGSSAHRAANLELSKEQSLLLGQDSMLLYADLETIKKKSFRSLPLTYFELEKALGLFGNLLGTVLGDAHPITVAFRAFWEKLIHSLRDELQTKLDAKGHIKPAHILRSIQLDMHAYFEDTRRQVEPVVPDFVGILHRIRNHTYILPRLPPPLYAALNPKAGGLTLSQGSVATQSTPTTWGSSDVSTISGTVPSFVAGSQAPSLTGTAPTGTFVPNLQSDDTISTLVPKEIKLRELIGRDVEPLSDSNRTMCLSYHLRPGCWSNCKRAYDHRVLTEPEKIRLRNFVNLQLAKINSLKSAATPPTIAP
jgi:hypothetical protein